MLLFIGILTVNKKILLNLDKCIMTSRITTIEEASQQTKRNFAILSEADFKNVCQMQTLEYNKAKATSYEAVRRTLIFSITS